MEIFLDKRAVKQIRTSATDAVDDGDTETLREDLMDAFSEEQIEEIERRIDGGDIYDFLSDVIEEWDADEVDELFELLESHLTEVGIELKYRSPELEEAEEEEEAEVDDEVDDDEDDDGLSEDEPLDLPDGDNE